MADVHSPIIRSYNMSRIRHKDTQPEIIVRKFLHSKGLRYRLNVKNLSGRPDIVMTKYRIIILVHGCFWHGHSGCKYYSLPKTRTEQWLDKISKNIIRDGNVKTLLKADGWETITIWECELKPKTKDETLNNLLKLIFDTKIQKL